MRAKLVPPKKARRYRPKPIGMAPAGKEPKRRYLTRPGIDPFNEDETPKTIAGYARAWRKRKRNPNWRPPR